MGVIAAGGSSASGTLAILALILAVAATILAFVFIVPEKRRNRLNAFGKFLHDTANFKYLIIEKVLQALYIFLTAYIVLEGFFMLFQVQDTWGGSRWLGGQGLLTMILGPIVVRIAYEGVLMFILLVKNVIQINNKLKANGDKPAEDVFANPVTEAPAAAASAFCTNCGAKVEGDSAFCTNCGTKLN